MLFKTDLFHLGTIKAVTIDGGIELRELLELIVMEGVYSCGGLDGPVRDRLYYNFSPMNMYQAGVYHPTTFSNSLMGKEHEVRSLKYGIIKSVIDVVDSFTMKYRDTNNVVLNIEGSLMNSSTIALSYDCLLGE